MPDTRDRSERSRFNLLFQETVNRIPAHEIAGLENHTSLFHRGGHLLCIGGGKSQRFFRKNMLLHPCGGKNELFMQIRFRADHHSADRRIIPDLFRSRYRRSIQLRGVLPGTLRIVVPDCRDLNILPPFHDPYEIRSVDVSAPDQCDLLFHKQ